MACLLAISLLLQGVLAKYRMYLILRDGSYLIRDRIVLIRGAVRYSRPLLCKPVMLADFGMIHQTGVQGLSNSSSACEPGRQTPMRCQGHSAPFPRFPELQRAASAATDVIRLEVVCMLRVLWKQDREFRRPWTSRGVEEPVLNRLPIRAFLS